MKVKKFEELNEGTWAFKSEHIDEFIKEIGALKDKYYNLIGDDDVFDGLDNAITRLFNLKDSN